jgi:uncharacterized protein YndB with AHSA1/START domain
MDGTMDGAVKRAGQAWEIRFERGLAESPEAVWRAITGPGQMSRWFDETHMPEPLRVGEQIRFHHLNLGMDSLGEITALDPPRLIEWLWTSPLGPSARTAWQITPEGGGCRLHLAQWLVDESVLARTLAGWHVSLDRLQTVLAGAHEPAPADWPALFERDRAQAKAAGAVTPQVGAPPKPRPRS